jgi:hypothetical protein
MPSRTTFLARLIGLYCVFVGLFMVTHKQATVDIVSGLVHNQTQLFFAGLIGISAGLAMVLGHNVWSGGPVAVMVTLSGWLSLIKGLTLLFLTPDVASVFFLDALHYEQFFFGYTAFTLLLGVALVAMTLRTPTGRAAVTGETHFFGALTHSK